MSIIKPITGTWFSIYWADRRHYYWNDACIGYSAEQWEALIADMRSVGIEYIVLCNTVAEDGLAAFPTKLAPQAKMAVSDPLEVVMTACDKLGMNVFMSNDYVGGFPLMEKENVKSRSLLMEELAEKYAEKAVFVKIDVDENTDTAISYKVSSIPNITVFKDGKPTAKHLGFVPIDALDAFFNENL